MVRSVNILNFGKLSVEHIYSATNIDFSKNITEIGALQTFAGGRGLNISVALSRAGFTKNHHAGIVGADGEFLRDALKNSGVNTSNIKIVDEATAHSIILLITNTEHKKFSFGGTNLNITKSFADAVLSKFTEEDILIIDDGISNYEYIIGEAQQMGMKIFFAPENTTINIDLSLLHHIFISEEQAITISGESKREEIIKYFKEKHPALRVLIDFSDNGFLYINKTQTLFQPAYKGEKVDTTAGFDTFIGYFIALVSKNKKIGEVLRLSSAARTLSVAKRGAAITIPYENEILAVIDSLTEYQTGENNRTLKFKQIVEDYINDNMKSAKIKGLAVILGYSEVYTGELLKTELGISFSQLLQKKRCEKASELLKSTRMSVKEIIGEVGYDNETFFRNKFKAFYGVTPSEYRKNYEKIIDLLCKF